VDHTTDAIFIRIWMGGMAGIATLRQHTFGKPTANRSAAPLANCLVEPWAAETATA